MRDTPRPAPTRDLDDPEEIAEMVRRFYADVAMDDLLVVEPGADVVAQRGGQLRDHGAGEG